jgi:hypothetical protein
MRRSLKAYVSTVVGGDALSGGRLSALHQPGRPIDAAPGREPRLGRRLLRRLHPPAGGQARRHVGGRARLRGARPGVLGARRAHRSDGSTD